MAGAFIVPLDLGDLTAEKSAFYMQRFTEEKVARHAVQFLQLNVGIPVKSG